MGRVNSRLPIAGSNFKPTDSSVSIPTTVLAPLKVILIQGASESLIFITTAYALAFTFSRLLVLLQPRLKGPRHLLPPVYFMAKLYK